MQIYYFSRTGRSRAIAETLAEHKGLQAREIVDDENWKGVRGFFKGGKMSKLKEETNARFTQPAEKERIVLVFPLWASGFPPSVREFVNSVGKENIIAICTSLGSRLKGEDREGFVQMIDLVGKQIEAPALSALQLEE